MREAWDWWLLGLALLLIALALLLSGCGASSPRYRRMRIQVSALCTVTLIRDLRTDACFLAYHCGVLRSGVAVVETDPEVCAP